MTLIIKSLDPFKKEVKKLAKRYKQISLDLKNLQSRLVDDPKAGISVGGNCYKIRLANSSVPVGKSGGFRVVYYYIDQNNTVYLMSIYSKNDYESISESTLQAILRDNGLLD